MKDLITKKHKHLLYKDELGEPFLLIKYGEIFDGGENTIVLYTWSKAFRNKVASGCKIIHETDTSDPLYILTMDRSNLGFFLNPDRGRHRINLNGARLKQAEIKLCHKIIPYNPELQEFIA